MALTNTACKNFKPSAGPHKQADNGGLYLLVSQTGKYWRYDYRHAGKRKTMALGVYPHTGRKLTAAVACLPSGSSSCVNRESGVVTKFALAAEPRPTPDLAAWGGFSPRESVSPGVVPTPA